MEIREQLFENILLSIQKGERETAKEMFEELNTDALKQGFNVWVNLLLENFDIENLDMFESMQYDNYISHSNKTEALQILINTVEGDTTQLSNQLAVIAEMQYLQYNLSINY